MGRKITYLDLIGQRFKYWVVISESEKKGKHRIMLCRCVCGKQKNVYFTHLQGGKSTSCGCVTKSTHQMSKTPTYRTWNHMLQRCNNHNNDRYIDYGGRGISVCKSWHLFENFLKDMGERPVNMSIERLDNDLGYYLNNCIWSDNSVQANNKRNSLYIYFNGKKQTASEWSKELNLPYGRLITRLRRGWDLIDVFRQDINTRRCG